MHTDTAAEPNEAQLARTAIGVLAAFTAGLAVIVAAGALAVTHYKLDTAAAVALTGVLGALLGVAGVFSRRR